MKQIFNYGIYDTDNTIVGRCSGGISLAFRSFHDTDFVYHCLITRKRHDRFPRGVNNRFRKITKIRYDRSRQSLKRSIRQNSDRSSSFLRHSNRRANGGRRGASSLSQLRDFQSSRLSFAIDDVYSTRIRQRFSMSLRIETSRIIQLADNENVWVCLSTRSFRSRWRDVVSGCGEF